MFVCEWKGKAIGINKRLDTTWKGKIYKNKEYKNFQETLIYEMIKVAKDRKTIENDCGLKIYMTISKQRDIDSLIKPVMDCLEKARIIKNDNLIRLLSVKKTIKKNKELDKIQIALFELKELR